MTEVEYGVHVSNKYALFLDDAPDPSDIITQLAVKPVATSKDDKSAKKKDKKSINSSSIGLVNSSANQISSTISQQEQPKSQKTLTSTTENIAANKNQLSQPLTTSSKSDSLSQKRPTNKISNEQQRRDENDAGARDFSGDKGGRGGGRRGRGGFPNANRGGGGTFDQDNNENRRPRGGGMGTFNNLPPRMGGGGGFNRGGFGGDAPNQEADQEDKFASRFGEAPRGGGRGRGGPGRGRGRGLRRGGGFNARNEGGGFGNENAEGDTGGGFNAGGGGNFGGGFGANSGFGSGGNFGDSMNNEARSGGGGGFGTFGGGFNERSGGGGGQDEFGGNEGSVGNFGGGFDTFGGQERGRGGRGRGFGRGRGRGGGGRGRQFDRQSGSDRSGVKPVDKREGGGAHNWGATGDEIEADRGQHGEENVGEEGEERVENREGNDEENANAEEKIEPAELTLDEWKALQTPRSKPAFNVRRPGEGEHEKAEWKKLIPLEREIEDAKEDEDTESVEEEDRHRKVQTVPIQINFIDEAARGGGPGARGSRGGRGGRGGFRGGNEGGGGGRGGRGGGFGRGFGGGGGGDRGDRRSGGGPYGGSTRSAVPYKMDEEAFPTLAGTGQN